MPTTHWDRIVAFSFVFTAMALATACSSAPSKLTPQQRASIEGKSVALRQPSMTHFGLVSSSATIAAAINPFVAGANAKKMANAGEVIKEQDHLVDPANVIGSALLADLQSSYGMTYSEANESGAAPPRVDFEISVEASSWSTMYLPTHPGRYGVMLIAKASLLESGSTKSLREAKCVIRPSNQPDAPTFTELLENDGVRLRAEVDYTTQACIEVLKHSLIGE